MSNEWIAPNTITGDAATGTRYLRRQHINDEFWREVGKGNHILFVAPRRVGKTSIMKDLEENPNEGYSCIYQNIEGVKTKNEFYKRLFELIIQCVERTATAKAKLVLRTWLGRYKIEEIGKSGLKLTSGDVDYERELRNIIPELAKTDTHTIIFLDEFAEVINKLNKAGRQEDAIEILHALREIRSESDFQKFTIVYAGSIGLHFVIKSMDRPKLINDLRPIETGQLNTSEAKELILKLIVGATIQLTAGVIEYLIVKINHLLPYYIQLMIEEIDIIAREAKEPEITIITVDHAFDRVLRKNKNFEDWLARLKEYQAGQFSFINEILKRCAHNGKISVQEVYDLAFDTKHNRQDDYMDFVEELMNDGYLVEEQKHTYRFISPFLQEFWLRKYPL